MTEPKSKGPCAKCHEPVFGGNGVRLDEDIIFCKPCFVCKACSEPLLNYFLDPADTFNHPGKRSYFCEKCFCETKLGSCTQCDQVFKIGEKILSSRGLKYHESCIACSVCAKTMPTGERHYYKNDQIYCSPCYDKTIPVCSKCSNQIMDIDEADQKRKFFTIEGKPYHKTCVACDECQTDLSDFLKLNMYREKFFCSIECQKSWKSRNKDVLAAPVPQE